MVYPRYQEISTYTQLPPKLQILVLINRTNIGPSIPSEDVTLSAFTVAPQLQFIDVGTVHHSNSVVVVQRYWNHLQKALALSHAGKAERVTTKTITFARGWGDDWWRERAASLGWINATEDMSYRYSLSYPVSCDPLNL